MACFESFDRMCKRIVCPNRLKVNERDIRNPPVMQLSARSATKICNINSSTSSIPGVRLSRGWSSSGTLANIQLYYTYMGTGAASCSCFLFWGTTSKNQPTSVPSISAGVESPRGNTSRMDSMRSMICLWWWTIWPRTLRSGSYTYGEGGTDYSI